MNKKIISSECHHSSHYLDVDGEKLHYLDEGEGDPILFLHGIPTSSYLWRNVIPHLSDLGRCIAPDLIGMGKSSKPDIMYSVFDHLHYIEKFILSLNLKNITFVLHGWGSLLGFDFAMRHEKLCRGLVFYEAFIKPFSEEEISLPFQEQIFELEKKIKKNEIVKTPLPFLDNILGQSELYPINEKIMAAYHAPFLQAGSGKPLMQYLNDLNSQEVNQFIAAYSEKLVHSPLPKLLLYSMPGFMTTIETVIWARNNLPNIEITDIGEALHYAQEINPMLMGESISVWLQGIEQTL